MPGRTTTLGYGHQHQQLRAQWAPIVALGRTVCTPYRHPQFPDCPGLITPADPWELGHDDTDKTKYTGPEHRTCNRRADGLKRIGKLQNSSPTDNEW